MDAADGGHIGNGGDAASKNKVSRGVDARGQYEKNGCYVLHTQILVAKKKMWGGLKVVMTCPVCNRDDVGLNDISISSKKSFISTKSNLS